MSNFDLFFDNPVYQEVNKLNNTVQQYQKGFKDWLHDNSVLKDMKGLESTAQQYQKDLNNWFFDTSLGQGITSLQDTTKNWFDQTALGKDINKMHGVYNQQYDDIKQDVQLKKAKMLREIYNKAFQQNPDFFENLFFMKSRVQPNTTQY